MFSNCQALRYRRTPLLRVSLVLQSCLRRVDSREFVEVDDGYVPLFRTPA